MEWMNQVNYLYFRRLFMVKKREDYISWDEYFMAIAKLSAMRSKDPSTQVGAVIVNDEKRIVSIGYNGMPNGISDDIVPWDREGSVKNTKYAYICHAEANAILNATGKSLKGCTIYVDLFPCNHCAQLIIQSGIKKVIYLSDKYHDLEEYEVSRFLFDHANVEYIPYQKKNKTITLEF